MKHSVFVFGLLSYALVALAIPANFPLEERQANPSGTPTDPPGSILATPAELPTYSPTAAVPTVALTSNFQWQIYKSCPDSNRAAINTAWADSKQLSDAFASWELNGAHQDAVDMYMGDKSNRTLTLPDPPYYYSYPQRIATTIQKHQGLFEGKSSTGNANLWVYCNDDSFWFSLCTKGDNPSVAVIAYEQEDKFFNNWYITFCPQFYNSSWEIPFQQMESDLKESNPYSNVMESYYGPPGTQAEIFFHETMHMSQLVTAPQAVDKAYRPLNVYNLAKNNNIESSLYNADSWTITALSIWAQQTFNLASPPLPAAIISPSPPLPADEPSNEDVYPNVIYVDAAAVIPQGASAVIPQGASAVPAGSSYFVDPTLWEIQNPAGGPAPPQPAPSTPTTATLAAVPSSTSAAPPAYATGNCSFHLTETQDCTTDATNLYAIVKLYDNNKDVIGETPTNSTNLIGDPINTSDPYNFDSKLPNAIVITGEHENDYVQFTYGGLSWTSRTTTGPATCSNGGWNPRDGPVCGLRLGNGNAVDNMDCTFPC